MANLVRILLSQTGVIMLLFELSFFPLSFSKATLRASPAILEQQVKSFHNCPRAPFVHGHWDLRRIPNLNMSIVESTG
jgi:hypothetical protein